MHLWLRGLVGLGRGGDTGHGADGRQRVSAGGGLGGEHDGIGPVENGVGDIGSFGTRGHRILDHALEHLRGDDAGLAELAAGTDDAFLNERYLCKVHLDAEIAAGDHDTVGGIDDRIEILHGLGHLDLGDDGDPSAGAWCTTLRRGAAHAREPLSELNDIGGLTDKGEREKIEVVRDGPSGALPIPFGNRGRCQAGIGQVDALVARDHPPHDDAADEFIAATLDRGEPHRTIVDQHGMTRLDLIDERLVGQWKDGQRTPHIRPLEGLGDSFLQNDETGLPREHRTSAGRVRTTDPCRDAPDPNLGPLQIAEAGDSTTEFIADAPHRGEPCGVGFQITMRKVESEDADTGADEVSDDVR